MAAARSCKQQEKKSGRAPQKRLTARGSFAHAGADFSTARIHKSSEEQGFLAAASAAGASAPLIGVLLFQRQFVQRFMRAGIR
jgi:hypothetical protein